MEPIDGSFPKIKENQADSVVSRNKVCCLWAFCFNVPAAVIGKNGAMSK